MAGMLGRSRSRGSLLSGGELLVAVRVWDELWPGCCAGPVVGYGSSLGPRMRVRGQIGSRLGRGSSSNENGGNSAVFLAGTDLADSRMWKVYSLLFRGRYDITILTRIL